MNGREVALTFYTEYNSNATRSALHCDYNEMKAAVVTKIFESFRKVQNFARKSNEKRQPKE